MQGAGAHKSRGTKIYWGRRSEDAWRGLVVELLREAAGRNKGWEEGDVQSIRRGDGCCGAVSSGPLYLPEAERFCVL
jgi:hypothetical protein